MRNLLKSRKAQFFVLSAFVIVSILLVISRWLEPLSIVDTSAVVLSEEPSVFNNIKEKAIGTVITSGSCEELPYNLEEYTDSIRKFSATKNFQINLDYKILEPCDNNILRTEFDLTLASPNSFVSSSFTANK